jgi:hypothetical protein
LRINREQKTETGVDNDTAVGFGLDSEADRFIGLENNYSNTDVALRLFQMTHFQ